VAVPQFRWDAYTLDRTRADVALEADDVAAEVLTVELPDLRAWQSPSDKAEILLESAAEIEHALMVQYLYAAYSLRSSAEVTDPAQITVLGDEPDDPDDPGDSWPLVIKEVAREEMGHLMTVQNLLLALGLPPNLEREDFPPRKDLYPFALHLEPLTQRSLAKYVVAEAPSDAIGIDDILELALSTGKSRINHVGVLYALLGVVFATPEQIQEGRTSGDPWDAMVSTFADLAYAQADAEHWHLPDSAFGTADGAPQAEPNDWAVSGVRVHRITDRATARAAIKDIGEQGEGPTSAADGSHFERFRRIFRGDGAVPAFPAAGEWTPTRNVPTDPTPDGCPDADTRRWVELADAGYGLLVGLVEHYLVSTGDERDLLTAWIFAEMRTRLGYLARKLTTLPTGASDGGVAGMPFTLPTPIHLPGLESARWALHAQRVQAVVAKAEEIQTAGGPVAAAEKDYLDALLAADRARLAFLADRATPRPVTTSFRRDIAPLFRPLDVQHMSDLVGLDLRDRATVADLDDRVLQKLRSTDPGDEVMPPPPGQRWTSAQTDLFARWVAEGHPE
jgi:Ferritin-like